MLTIAIKLMNKAQTYLDGMVKKRLVQIAEKEATLVSLKKELAAGQRMLKGVNAVIADEDEAETK